jgi:hypothetical protein
VEQPQLYNSLMIINLRQRFWNKRCKNDKA